MLENRFIVVIWGDTYMSFIPAATHTLIKIKNDRNVMFDMAQDADIILNTEDIARCVKHVETFGELSTGTIIELTPYLQEILVTLTELNTKVI